MSAIDRAIADLDAAAAEAAAVDGASPRRFSGCVGCPAAADGVGCDPVCFALMLEADLPL